MPDAAADGGLRIGELSPSVPLFLDVLPGDVRVGRLAADLTRAGVPPRWLRLAPYDLDRSTLDTLATTVLDGAVPTSADRLLVVESDDRRQAERFLSRLTATEPAGTVGGTVVLLYVRPTEIRGGAAPRRQVPPRHGWDDEPLERLIRHRRALRTSVLDTERRLRAGELAAIVDMSRSLHDLTTRLASRLLQDVPPRTATLLGLVAQLGYCHRRFSSLEPVLDDCADLPWWIDLTGGWRRFEPAWRDAVRTVCGTDGHPHVPLLGPLVSELAADGAVDAAVELCLDAGYPGMASDLLAGLGPDLLATGRPLALARWLRRLPRATRRRHRALAGQLPSTRWAFRVPAAGRRRDPRRPGLPGPDARPERGQPSDRTLPTRASPAAGPPAGWTPAAIRAPLATPRPAVGRPPASPAALDARLLGPLEVSVGGARVERWHGRKGTLLLAYVLLHRTRPVPRDILAVTFWPDAPPDASRNRLHVALHALRADLQAAAPMPVVIFERGYLLNPELTIRLDTEVFARAVTRGDRAEEREDVDAALAEYREAVREYRGDLLDDHPYDDWTLLPRQHYRVRMLDVLGRTAQLAFDTGRYPESVDAGQRLLSLDFCREDLHRLLMRAYCRLGRPHLALSQYEVCARQLRRELDMAPAQETVELYRRVRSRSEV